MSRTKIKACTVLHVIVAPCYKGATTLRNTVLALGLVMVMHSTRNMIHNYIKILIFKHINTSKPLLGIL